MAKAPNIVPLKILVISLGFVLVGGTIFVFAALLGKVGKTRGPCNDVSVSVTKLNVKGQIINIVPLGNNIHVTFADAGQTTVATVDRCSGVVQQKFTITP